MSSTNIKELDLEVENSIDKGNSKACIRLQEFQRNNTMDSIYWKNVEKQLKLEGKYFRTGQFSEAENNQLTKNWKRLIKKYPLDNPAAILRKNICPEAKETIKTFLNETNFYINLGHKINRSPYAVYVRARRLFNDVERVGKYNEDEVEKLQELESSLGNKWQKIGRKLGRCPNSASRKIHSMRKDVVKGRWTDEEDKQLKDAVLAIMNEKKEEGAKKTKEETFFKLPWKKISDHVPTRNAKQCRERWMLHEQIGDDETKWKKRNKKFGKLQKVKLVNKLISLEPIDESAIDWMQLHSHFPEVTSPQSLYQKWYDIKRGIPKYKSMELKEILAIAKEKVSANVKDEISSSDDDDDCNETNNQDQTQNISRASKLKSKKFSQVNKASRNDDDCNETNNQNQTQNISRASKLKSKKFSQVNKASRNDDDDDCNETNNQNQTQNISRASKLKSKKFSQVNKASRNGDNKLEDLDIKTEDEDDHDHCQVEEYRKLKIASRNAHTKLEDLDIQTEDEDDDDHCQVENPDDAIGICIETVKVEPNKEDVLEENRKLKIASRNAHTKLEDLDIKTEDDDEDEGLDIKTEDEDDDDHCQVENPDGDAIGICIETVKVEPNKEDVLEENRKLKIASRNAHTKLEDLDIKTEDEDDPYKVENPDDDTIRVCIETVKVEPYEEDDFKENHFQIDSAEKKKSKRSKKNEDSDDESESVEITDYKPPKKRKRIEYHLSLLAEDQNSREKLKEEIVS